MNFKNCIVSCAVGFLSVWPVACANKVTTCAADCEEQHPEGLRVLHSYMSSCACRSCSDACTQSVCVRKETPSNACLPCMQEGLTQLCSTDGFFKGGCLDNNDKDCTDLFACITTCQ